MRTPWHYRSVGSAGNQILSNTTQLGIMDFWISPGCSRSTHPRRIRAFVRRDTRWRELSPRRHHRNSES